MRFEEVAATAPVKEHRREVAESLGDDNPTVDVSFDEKKNRFVLAEKSKSQMEMRKSQRDNSSTSQSNMEDERLFKSSPQREPQRKAVAGHDLFASKLIPKTSRKPALATKKRGRAQVIVSSKTVPSHAEVAVEPDEARKADARRMDELFKKAMGPPKRSRPIGIVPTSLRSQTGTEVSSIMSTKSGEQAQ